MITGVHTMFYTSQPDKLRAFLRDTLGFHGTDVGQGWLIFDMPEAEMGCHPSDPQMGGKASGTADISFYCDDIAVTVADLKSKGVEFTADVQDMGYGLITHFKVPGDFTVQLFQPRYSKSNPGSKDAENVARPEPATEEPLAMEAIAKAPAAEQPVSDLPAAEESVPDQPAAVESHPEPTVSAVAPIETPDPKPRVAKKAKAKKAKAKVKVKAKAKPPAVAARKIAKKKPVTKKPVAKKAKAKKPVKAVKPKKAKIAKKVKKSKKK